MTFWFLVLLSTVVGLQGRDSSYVLRVVGGYSSRVRSKATLAPSRTFADLRARKLISETVKEQIPCPYD